MAPLPEDGDSDIFHLDGRSVKPSPALSDLHIRSVSPLDANDVVSHITKREETSTFTPGVGTQPPTSFNNNGILALFAIIGASMVLASLWFFFWSKNGGFKFQEGDWEDYKSTVLRRKGPDGKTLSNATKSTKLGGSTIAGTHRYHMAKQQARSVVGHDSKGRKGFLGKRGWAGTHSITYSDDYMTQTSGPRTVSDMTEARPPRQHHQHHPPAPPADTHSKRYRDRDVQDYKRERPARVGGLNRVADGSHMDTSADGSTTTGDAATSSPRTTRDHEHAERRAREDAARMERRWKKEAEEAAAALARENHHPPAPARTPRTASSSPRKHRDGAGTEATSSHHETANTYYDSYRPRRADEAGTRRQGSPQKKGGPGRSGGYRRGAVDSDFE